MPHAPHALLAPVAHCVFGVPRFVFREPQILPVPEFVQHIQTTYTKAKARKILDGLLKMHKDYLKHAEDGARQSAIHTAHSSQRAAQAHSVHH